jgi:hypothetical protein
MQQNVNRTVNIENEILLDYTWGVPTAGHLFAERLYDERGTVLPSGIVEHWGAVEGWKRLTLKDHPALYRKLLTVDVSNPSKILAFANKWGLLDQRQQVTEDPPQRGKKALAMLLVAGNTLAFWQEQVRTMHRAVTLWDHARVKDRTWLTKRIEWKGEPDRFGYRPEPDEQRPAVCWFPVPHVSNVNLQAQFTPDNVVFLARYILQQLINAQLTAQVAPMLLWRRSGTIDLYFRPLSLCGAMWLQLAEDVTRNRVLRLCEYCKTRRVVGAVQKKYCSDSCKTMACRAKQKSA